MSTIADLQGAIATQTGLINASITAYNGFITSINAIDPASPTAGTDLNVIVDARTAYHDANVAALNAAASATKEAQANLGPEDTNQGATLMPALTARIGVLSAAAQTFDAANTGLATLITNSQPKPVPNLISPVAGPTPVFTTPATGIAPTSGPTKSSAGLNKFISLIKGKGLVLTSKYSIQLPPIAGFDTGNVALQCSVAGMPDLSLGGSELHIYGESTEIATNISYGPLQLSFLVTNDFDTLGYFEAWSNLVYDRLQRSVGFYRDYAFETKLNVMDRGGNVVYSVNFMDCWPKNINSSTLSNDSHSVMTVNVSLRYKYWKSNVGADANLTTTQPWDGLPNTLQIPTQPPLFGSVLGVGAAADFSTAVDIYNNNGLAASSFLGGNIGANLLSSANGVAGTITGLSGGGLGGSLGTQLGSLFGNLGTSSSIMGGGISGIAGNLGNILAPAGQIAVGVTGISGALGSINNLLGRAGIHTNLGNTVSNLNNVAGMIAVTGQLHGIPGALGSLGGAIGSISGDIAQIQRSIGGIPGATSALNSTLGNLSSSFTGSGDMISSISNMNW